MNAPHLEFSECKTLAEALTDLEDGDLLLYRRRRSAIAVAGRGIHSHAAMLAWWDNCPMVIETRGRRDARAVTLESQVAAYPGLIDVYKADPAMVFGYNRRAAVAYMRSLTGQRYGWLAVWRVAAAHIPVLRWFLRPVTDDAASNGLPPFCSDGVSQASRLGGGVDPVLSLADFSTEPADLARSTFYKFLYTLTG